MGPTHAQKRADLIISDPDLIATQSMAVPPAQAKNQPLAARITALEEIIGFKFSNPSLPARALESGPQQLALERVGDLALSLILLELEVVRRLETGSARQDSFKFLTNRYLKLLGELKGVADLITPPLLIYSATSEKGTVSDCMEAIIGAVYIEGGYQASKLVFCNLATELGAEDKLDNFSVSVGNNPEHDRFWELLEACRAFHSACAQLSTAPVQAALIALGDLPAREHFFGTSIRSLGHRTTEIVIATERVELRPKQQYELHSAQQLVRGKKFLNPELISSNDRVGKIYDAFAILVGTTFLAVDPEKAIELVRTCLDPDLLLSELRPRA